MDYKEKIEERLSDYLAVNNEKPRFIILHPVYVVELARQLFAESMHNLNELGAFFGVRVLSTTDVSPDEVILAK